MIYLDYNASTPMASDVKKSVSDAFEIFANPSGVHSDSRLAESRFEKARTEVAKNLNVHESEVIFTSGSTEAITLSIWGILLAAPVSRTKVLISSLEHAAVIETAKAVCKVTGKELVVIPADRDNPDLHGQIDLKFLKSQLDSKTALVAVMAVNNETGVIQPIEQISQLSADFEVPFLCDSTQAIGKWENFLKLKDRGIFMVSGHKIYGQKGTGVMVLPRGLQKSFYSISPGGGQERGIRGGTLNLSGAVGLASALTFANSGLEEEMWRQEILRDRLFFSLEKEVKGELRRNTGIPTFTLKNTLNIQFVGVQADAILASLRYVQASRASACSTGVEEPSHVLLAMGCSGTDAEESLRFSLGRFTSEEDIDAAIEDVSAAVTRVRAFS